MRICTLICSVSILQCLNNSSISISLQDYPVFLQNFESAVWMITIAIDELSDKKQIVSLVKLFLYVKTAKNHA